MPSAETVAHKLRAKDTGENGRTPSWPPCEPLTVLQVRTFPQALLDRLKVLAILKHKRLPEVTAMVVKAGLAVVENQANNGQSED